MRKLKNSRKFLSRFLLGSFLISLLLLPNFNNVPFDLSEQKSPTQDNLTSEEKSPTHDEITPQSSTPAPDVIYTKTFNINQSTDDAWNTGTFSPVTQFSSPTLDLGGSTNPKTSKRICLRWNISIPKNVRIIDAYIELTCESMANFDGFQAKAFAFNSTSTPPFNDPSENVYDRELLSFYSTSLIWPPMASNQTFQFLNIKNLLESVTHLDKWKNNSAFGMIIVPSNYLKPGLTEYIYFWSYDGAMAAGKPEYCPKLVVKWEESPYLVSIPSDITVKNGTKGYYSLEWGVWDDNPATFNITCDKSVSGVPYIDSWQAGVVSYNLPALDVGTYIFTAYFYDADGNYEFDSVIVTSKQSVKFKIFNITQSEDDAFSNSYIPGTYTNYTDIYLHLGGAEAEGFNTGIALRWNITVPKNTRIINAYINLTVAITGKYGFYDGFDSSISVFDEPSTNNFSNISEYISNRSRIGGGPSYLWELDGTELVNKSIKTMDISDLIEYVMALDSWDGIIGTYIKPGAGTEFLEIISFWSYDYGKPEYFPKLFIEYDEGPFITDKTTDMTINNNTLGYHIEWTAIDNNPSTYNIIGNETINESPKRVQSGEWQRGVEIRYDIPKIDIKNYDYVVINYTIKIIDADGNFQIDSIFINVTDKGLPIIKVIKFIQNNREVDHFQPGDGDFTVRLYGQQGLNLKIILTAFYPNFILCSNTKSSTIIGYANATIWCTGDTIDHPLIYINLPYNSELGCYELVIPSSEKYIWTLWLEAISAIGTVTQSFEYANLAVQDIRYNVVNQFLIGIMGGGDPEFVYKGRVYGAGWGQCKFEILNDDLTPPIFTEPEFIEPDEPDKHYEITINVATEENGADVKDVWLYYSVDDGVWEETIMVLQEGTYYGEIPPQEENSKITYYIRIVDEAGHVIETDEYTEKATIFEEPSLIIPILGVFIAILGALSIVAIYRHKSKAALKKHPSEKSPKKSEKGPKRGNKLLQKIKKVRKKQ